MALSQDVKVRIDPETRKLLQATAKREDRSESAIVRRALRQYLDSLDNGRRSKK